MHRWLALLPLLVLASTTHALHFYLDANEKRCFIEEIPTDTVVEGNYKALEWSEARQLYVPTPELGILVEVEVNPTQITPEEIAKKYDGNRK